MPQKRIVIDWLYSPLHSKNFQLHIKSYQKVSKTMKDFKIPKQYAMQDLTVFNAGRDFFVLETERPDQQKDSIHYLSLVCQH